MPINLDMLPGWRSPGNYALDSEQASASIGHNFGAAFNSAANRKQEQSQFAEKKQMVADQNAAKLASDTAKAEKMTTGAELISSAKTMDGLLQLSSEHPYLIADKDIAPIYGKQMDYLSRAQTAELNSIDGKAKISVMTGFTKGMGKLAQDSPADWSLISSMERNKDGTPSAAQINALSLSNERLNAQRENDVKQREVDALNRGDVATTTIKEDGKFSVNFKPKKPESGNDEAGEIKYDTPFPDMPWVKTAMTAKGTLHVIKGEAPMTVNQRARAASTIASSEKKFNESKDPSEQTYLRTQINILKNALKPVDKRTPIETNESAPASQPAPVEKPAAPEVLPFPKTKADAIEGKVYQTKSGPMKWTGSVFTSQ